MTMIMIIEWSTVFQKNGEGDSPFPGFCYKFQVTW